MLGQLSVYWCLVYVLEQDTLTSEGTGLPTGWHVDRDVKNLNTNKYNHANIVFAFFLLFLLSLRHSHSPCSADFRG